MRARPRLRACGFSLVELMVTVIIAGVAFAGIVPLFVNAQKTVVGDRMRSIALNLAQDRIEKVRQLDFDQITKENLDSSTFAGGQFGTAWTATSGGGSKQFTISNQVRNETTGGFTAYKQVTITVSWTGPPFPVKPVRLDTMIARSYAGPQIIDLALSPLNGNGDVNGTPVTIAATVATPDRGSTAQVLFYVYGSNGTEVAQLTQTTGTAGVYSVQWDASGASNGLYSFRAQAYTSAGDVGNTWVRDANLVLNSAPAQVGHVTATAGDRRIVLRWDSSTASDFDHFEVWRGTSPTNQSLLVTLTANGYIDTGLTNGTTYYYTVYAVDTDGNRSVASTTVSKAPGAKADTTAPTTPGAFGATRSDDTAALSWTASTDNVAVAGYFVYRDGGAVPYAVVEHIPDSPGYSFNDLIGWAVPHSYYVVAYDSVGLMSAPTATLTVSAGTPPLFTLTVTTNQASPPGSVDLVQTDAVPQALHLGVKSIAKASPAVWTDIPYGSYRITTTWNGQTKRQDIKLTSSASFASGF